MLLTYFSLQFALPHLRKTKGNIINMSSLVAQIGQPGAVAYVASKVINILTFYNHVCVFCSFLKCTDLFKNKLKQTEDTPNIEI